MKRPSRKHGGKQRRNDRGGSHAGGKRSNKDRKRDGESGSDRKRGPGLDQKLLNLMRAEDYTPMDQAGLVQALRLGKQEIRRLKNHLQSLIKEGTVARIKGDRYCVSTDADLLSGTIRFRASGTAFLSPDTPESAPTGKQIMIRAEDTGVSLHGDHVLVRLDRGRPANRFRKGRRYQNVDFDDVVFARVIRILKRNNPTIVGTLQNTRIFHHVVPDDPRFNRNILVPDPKHSNLKPRPKLKDKVVVRLLEWKQAHLNPEGEIVEVLGKTHTPKAEFEGILRKYNLDPDFPPHVMKEVEELPAEVTLEACANRLDCRGLHTFTIDPDDAKDFDDALSVEYLPKGDVRIGVHIADVSAYVASGTQLDREAAKRGNSSYLVGCVIPMLPHALSNGLCSLVEAEDRLTKSVFFTFGPRGRLKESHFANTVIRSNKRLTYAQALAFLEEDDLEKIADTPLPPAHQTGSTGRPLSKLSKQELADLQKGIRRLWKIAAGLREARMKKGSLDLDMPEVKIYVDKQGYADRIVRTIHDISHQLIEEFMLLANEEVARKLNGANMPYISRVHDSPDEDKLNELRDYLLSVGLATGDLNKKREVTRLLQKLKDHPEGYTLKIQFLRSLKQACYRASADGHYGLDKAFYAHFTSPIRRYADLIVHRIFDHYLQKHGIATAPDKLQARYNQGKLESLSEHITITEQNSTEAERDSVKVKLLEYFEREAAREDKRLFAAIITDVRNHGIFIELCESLAFGMIPMSSLRDDLYRLSQDKRSIVGRKQHRSYTIGQTVHVTVERVDRFKRHIDFRLSTES